MTLKRDWIPSPNYSSRGGSGVRLVIVHTAEGALTYEALGSFFGSSSSGVSSHTGIDDTPGRIGEYVKPGSKAWTAGDANPYSMNTELCGFAAWQPEDWERHPVMLDNCARWIAEECKRHGIPIRKLSSSQAMSGSAGVCGHVDVSGPSGHWDPGPCYPWHRVIDVAISGGPVYGEPAPAPPPPEPLQLPPAYLGGLSAMPPDYIVHDTNKDNYYACYSSGLVRLVTKAERDQLKAGETGGPPIKSVGLSDENGNRYLDYDRALRGMLEKRSS